MLLADVIEDYLAYCRVEKGLTVKTCKSYTSMSRLYVKWLKSTGYVEPTLDDFNPTTLKKYLYYVSGTLKYRPRSIRGCFFPLRGLGEYLKEMGVFMENPAHSVKMPKLDAATRELLSDVEVRQLFDACDRVHDSYRAVLAKGLLSVFIFGGLRRQEALDLKVGDLNFDERCIIVRQGKGMNSRTIYPHPDCLVALRDLLSVRPAACRHEWLFAYSAARRVAHTALHTILKEITAISGIGKPIVPHTLRHNCATRLLRNGADMESLRVFLGHSLLSTTAVYVHSDVTRQREIAAFGSLRKDFQPKRNPTADRREAPSKRSERIREVRKVSAMSYRLRGSSEFCRYANRRTFVLE